MNIQKKSQKIKVFVSILILEELILTLRRTDSSESGAKLT
jgi:hypothetical protein